MEYTLYNTYASNYSMPLYTIYGHWRTGKNKLSMILGTTNSTQGYYNS